MATDVPDLINTDFNKKVEEAIEKAINILRSKCVDGQIYRSEFELKVNDVFREFGLEPEQEEYDKIELALNNEDCIINERFMTFDKFVNELHKSKWVFEGNFEVTKDMVTDGKFISGKIPDEVTEDFNCSKNQLTSLEGCPKKVGGFFRCFDNQLTSLEGCPKKIGGFFICSNNQLTSLEGAPTEVSGNFKCSNNKLTSLEGCPEKVSGNFGCYDNQLTSLEGCPEKVSGYFDCSNNQLTSLEGGPTEVGGDFYCSKNQLTSLEGGPSKVDGIFDCFDNRFPLEIERDFIKAGRYVSNYGETNGYWMDLLKYMIDERIRLDKVLGWPEGFLTDEVIRSARGINKYKL